MGTTRQASSVRALFQGIGARKLLMSPTYCPFAPRCRYALDRCYQENPTMKAIAPDHYAACWRAEEVYDGLRILEYAAEEVPEEVAA